MAGIFKSLDKSDVRITPFHTHKLWSDNLGYESKNAAYGYYGLASLENINLSKYLYAFTVDANAFLSVIHKVDVTDNYTILNTNTLTISAFSDPLLFETPPIGPADMIIAASDFATGVGITFLSGSDLSIVDSNLLDVVQQPAIIYNIVTGWDYITPNQPMAFVGTDKGLYSCQLNIATLNPITSWVRHHSVLQHDGEYKASTQYVYGQAIPSILSAYRDFTNRAVLVSHRMLVANNPIWSSNASAEYYDNDKAYSQNYNTSVKRLILMHGSTSNQDVLWTLFEDGNLWVCKPDTPPTTQFDTTYMTLVATGIADLQTDYDLVYNPNYAIQPTPTTTTLSRKLFIIDRIGIILADATSDGNSIAYKELIDCRQYVGPQKTITKTFITKNTDTPILGVYAYGGVQASTIFTMNTKTYELSDPIFTAILKNSTTTFRADYRTDGIYATDYNGPIWYKFTI
jgi:hypothetical protein